jgi:hypothetical protein
MSHIGISSTSLYFIALIFSHYCCWTIYYHHCLVNLNELQQFLIFCTVLTSSPPHIIYKPAPSLLHQTVTLLSLIATEYTMMMQKMFTFTVLLPISPFSFFVLWYIKHISLFHHNNDCTLYSDSTGKSAAAFPYSNISCSFLKKIQMFLLACRKIEMVAWEYYMHGWQCTRGSLYDTWGKVCKYWLYLWQGCEVPQNYHLDIFWIDLWVWCVTPTMKVHSTRGPVMCDCTLSFVHTVMVWDIQE